jgi:tetratricopeptide (TPR) repeat protein
MAWQELYKLLQECTVRLSSPSGIGTGFFLAPGGWILTCAHVVEQSDSVEVLWPSGESPQKLIATVRLRVPIPVDIALLQLEGEAPAHKCVYLDQSPLQIGDTLYTFGYPQGYGAESYSGGDSATTEYEGKSFQDDVLVLKMKEGQIQEGYSGSPLLNERTGKVCGIVSISRDTGSDLGGRATPIPLLFQPKEITASQDEQQLILSTLEGNKKFHTSIDKTWRDIVDPPFWARKSVIILTSSILLLLTSSLFIWQWLDPWVMPKGVFNVAITDFTTVDENGKMQRLEEGKNLGAWVTNLLKEEKDESKSTVDTANWYVSKPNKYYITADSITELRGKVESFAKCINADVLIYGYLTKTDNLDDKLLTLGFYVSSYDNLTRHTGLIDTFDDKFDNYALKGNYQIGEPQLVNINDTGAAEGFLSSRVKPLFWLVAGLTYRSNPAKALKIFKKAENYINEEWKAGGGKEVFYFCMGQVALFAANAPNVDPKDTSDYAQQAENAFKEALKNNDKYLRPLIGLGSVYLTRAEWDYDQIDQLPKGTDPNIRSQLQKKREAELNAALASYEEAFKRLPQSQPDKWSEYAAPLGLGTTWILKGWTYLDINQYQKAGELQENAVEIIQKILKPLAMAEEYRLLGQAYSNLGSAYWLGAEVRLSEGDQKSSLAMRQKASEAFLLCKSQGEKAPNDLILNQQIVKDCKDNKKLVEK